MKKRNTLRKFTIIVNVSLRYDFIAKNGQEAIEKVKNVELPNEYCENTFEIVKIIDPT